MTAGPVKFCGLQQPMRSRKPEIPPVDYRKGGDDFRCPHFRQTSSFGRQVLSYAHTKKSASIRFAEARRFGKADTVGVGPAGTGQPSSLGKQALSNRRAAGGCTFGTSTREGALKLYAIYTATK
tara:strand:+ start:56 stop:427 length:372 start_codon:yes stop_codon:yes gene_type:complete